MSTPKRKTRWIDADALFERLHNTEVDGSVVFDTHHYIKIRHDLLAQISGTKLGSIPVFNSGALVARVEAAAQYNNSPQARRAEHVMSLGLASGGVLLQPAFITYMKHDARVSQRFYREEDCQNWCAFYLFCERAALQVETAKKIADLAPPLQGLLLYHLWVNADLKIDRESPPERIVWT